jgi:hypothetical protein
VEVDTMALRAQVANSYRFFGTHYGHRLLECAERDGEVL